MHLHQYTVSLYRVRVYDYFRTLTVTHPPQHNLLPYIFFQLWRTQSHIFKLFDLGTSMATESYEPYNSELKTRI